MAVSLSLSTITSTASSQCFLLEALALVLLPFLRGKPQSVSPWVVFSRLERLSMYARQPLRLYGDLSIIHIEMLGRQSLSLCLDNSHYQGVWVGGRGEEYGQHIRNTYGMPS